MNRVLLIGRLTKDPETRFSGETAVTRMTIAVDRVGKEKVADSIRVTVFGKQGENCQRYLSKGRQIAVEGRIQTGSYDKNGEKVYTTDVIADRVEFLGGGETTKEPGAYREVGEIPSGFSAVSDIPF